MTIGEGMEKLLHYVWKHKFFPAKPLFTTDGKPVEIVDVGLHNSDAGPDFFNAKIKIDGQMWVGNVELHIKSSHWYQHGHDKDGAYDNVVLHVVTDDDMPVENSKGERLHQLVVEIPEKLQSNYAQLLTEDRYPRCFRIIPTMQKITLHSWLSALQTERLERKTQDIMHRLEECNGSWEDAYFRTLARNYGYGVNNEAFEAWAKSFDLKCAGHHRDDVFQVEAIFMGQAGLLDIYSVSEAHREQMDKDLYFHRLSSEYKYMAHKFSLTPIDHKLWKFLRLRPQNFPYIRLSQLATLYVSRKAGFSQLIECKNVKELSQLLQTQVSDYWKTHYMFGEESEPNEKKLSQSSIDILLINTVIPLLFAYGRSRFREDLVDRALEMLEQLKPENNNIVRMWRECSFHVENAGDSQALIQLKKEYCDRKECLRCRIGYYYLKNQTM